MSSTHNHGDDHGPGGHDPAAEGPKVLAVSDRHPRVRTIQIVRPGVQDVTFLSAATKGLGITLKHFARNLFLPLRSAAARSRAGAPDVSSGWSNEIETVQYPEEKVTYPERFRGLHRLMLRDDGNVRCVACMCCPTVCPAHCITIVAEETGNGSEKRPRIFEIDELRCIDCGLCVEACPCDAIRMDTGIHMPPSFHRHEAILGKNDLLSRGIPSVAVQGGVPDWQEPRPGIGWERDEDRGTNG
jgi:NADH-quinone oxidoreductase subunit I